MLAKWDAALGERSRALQFAFRGIASVLVGIGLFAWCGLWFERSRVLGIIQAVIVAELLLRELRAK